MYLNIFLYPIFMITIGPPDFSFFTRIQSPKLFSLEFPEESAFRFLDVILGSS